ncbi:MAG: SURF1 family protein [Rhodospirillales bacterium]|jgi:surfeit locus 1 family protein
MSAPLHADAGGRRFRPSPGFTLFALGCLVVLIGLGTWQLERLAWKADLVDRIGRQVAAPPVPLPGAVSDAAAWDYRRVAVTGRFLHDREMLVGGKPLHGRVGWHVVTPLERADGGGSVLVMRGWVPDDRRDPARRAEGQVTGAVTVEGIARIPAPRAWMQPEDRPAENVWYVVDVAKMAAAARLAGPVAPVVVEAGPQPVPGGLPEGGRTRLSIPNNHLQYVITWYGLAGALVAVWIARSIRRRRADPEETAG